MIRLLSLNAFLLFFLQLLPAQEIPLSYYFPEEQFEKDIPSPEDVLGFQIGEWHLSHDQLVRYMIELATSSNRVQWQEYGRTYEDRPLILLTISSEKNLDKLEDIRKTHLQNCDPKASPPNMDKQPVVVYQGFSIHGNEPSGSNAAALLAYYLAAGKGRELEKLLDETVILLDPCFNPDGLHRFSTWANMHKSAMGNADPQSREFNEVWPGGRTNHYWFDLNRDWLLAQHPESQGRLALFHQWKPNVLTDHHEMGTNATFFFQPGVPQRTNPITPNENQELTAKIGQYHADALDQIGSLYYSQENFDDFYYGKGSTYPDVNGSIGILFEQASSRGHVQESQNGLVEFPFTIRNQLTAARSTLAGAQGLRSNLLDYQRRFYLDGRKEAIGHKTKAYVFNDPADQTKVKAFAELLQRHSIQVFELGKEVEAGGQRFEAGKSFIVPLDQDQFKLIRTIFEPTDDFRDSLFYDVSAWTLPMAFNLAFSGLEKADFSANLIGGEVSEDSWVLPEAPEYSDYAYLLEWDDYAAPAVVNKILEAGLRAKVALDPLRLNDRNFDRGTILIPVANQNMDPENLYSLIQQLNSSYGVQFYETDTGLSPSGIDLGSSRFQALQTPHVLIIGGNGAYSYEVGEMWYVLEERFGIPASIIETDRISRVDLGRYNVILMAHGSYDNLGSEGVEQIKSWVANGGTLWCQRGAVNWAISNQLSGAAVQKTKKDSTDKGEDLAAWRAYSYISPDQGSRVIGGAILQTQTDLSHPLLFGMNREELPVFRRGTLFLENTENPYASPIRYTQTPVLSGYVHRDQVEQLKGAPAVVISRTGSGRVICFADNPNFRAYWYGTQKLTANAVFFGHLISGQACEKIKPEKK